MRREAKGYAGSRCWLLGAVLLSSATLPLGAQSVEGGRAGPREVLTREFEIALARSAAPAAVSEDATVFVWTGSDFEIGAVGSNGVSCYVARSWPESLEPHCFDEEGSRTVMRAHMLQMRLWHEGGTPDQVNSTIAEGLRTGDLQLPSRPVMSYMMSAGQDLISDEGQPAGSWQPHLMIYYPYLTSEALGLGSVPSTEAAIVVDPGTPFSNIMVVVKNFVPFDGGGASNGR